MSKSVSLAVAASLAVAGLASAASAATFTPNSSSTTVPVTFAGTLTLGPTPMSCSTILTGVVNPGGGSVTITGGSMAPGSWQCGWLAIPASFPWTLTPLTTAQVSLSPMALTGGLSECSGVVTASWANPGTIIFNATVIPGAPACQVSGALSSTPNVAIQ
ncbi:protein activator of alkane oxidation PraB [Caulobacter sp. D4A]|uniref:protein activator of alkane oxidation PraB n=1 Tax=unclassified Caulobacter TaxID=2648921 RepID=UPI000D725FE9|nr:MULTISPECIES: protein activator of alkane oxidation PraB [unclassified Caulobacter]PXA84023.1 protein activator of alkane oxidation PraB [Caulobacter sp. D4A]PXA94251.1 protein activator of alkane oxidation PraB [Caulobacter sp. D5]